MRTCVRARQPLGHEGDRGDAALPCSRAGTSGKRSERLPGPSRARTLRVPEGAGAPWKVVLPPPAERRRQGRRAGAARGAGRHIGVSAGAAWRSGASERCPGLCLPAGAMGARPRHPAAPAARLRCQRKVSSSVRGTGKREGIAAGRERGRGQAACLCCSGCRSFSPPAGKLPPSSALNLFRCGHSGLLAEE